MLVGISLYSSSAASICRCAITSQIFRICRQAISRCISETCPSQRWRRALISLIFAIQTDRRYFSIRDFFRYFIVLAIRPAFGARSGTMQEYHIMAWWIQTRRNLMNNMKRDPLFIADQLKFIRKMYSFTQENLADASGMTTRTIQKVESGRHIPDEQTLRSICRVFQIELSYFDIPSPDQVELQIAKMKETLKKTVVVPISPINSAQDFLNAFEMRQAFRIDTSMIDHDKALSVACGMGDLISDYIDIWDEVYMSQRLGYAKEIVSQCKQVSELGFTCFIGTHMQQMRAKERPALVINVVLMTFLPNSQSGKTRYGLVQLDGNWECMGEDIIKEYQQK